MADLISRQDLLAIGRDYVRQRATKIDPYQVDVLGSDVNIFVGVTSVMASAIIMQLAYATNRLLLDGAEKEDLDRYAYDRYSMTRKGASAAVTSLRVYRAAIGVAGTVSAGTLVRTANGIQYVLTTNVFFGASDLESYGNVRAVEAGKSNQVGANSLISFVNPSDLFDQTLQCINDARAAGGEDIEDDDTFRSRIQLFWSSARRGTLTAIEFGAMSVDGVVSAKAVEAVAAITIIENNDTHYATSTAMPARVVNLYVADSSGVSNSTLANIVSLRLDDYRAAGIAVLITTSTPQIIDIQLHLTFKANVDTLTISQAVIAAITDQVNSLAVNQTLMLPVLYAVLQRFTADGLIVGTGTIVSPTGDLVPNPGQTIRTYQDHVTLV